MPKPSLTGACRALLEVVYPESCALCGAVPGERPWLPAGPRRAGLTRWDRPHLCRACADDLAPRPAVGRLPGPPVAVHAGRATDAALITVVGQWKYHGVRGLAWPLSDLLAAAIDAACCADGPVDRLVPVPLHRRRERARGFNQARVLATLAGDRTGLPSGPDIVYRIRATGQQARLAADAERRRNVAGAFRAPRGPRPGEGRRLGLVDDLVTGGATGAAAAAALIAAGWQVVWLAALGLGRRSDPVAGTPSVDTAGAEI